MKIKQLQLQSPHFQSFNIRRDRIPQYHHVWHYHEELELILVLQGSGRLYVGDRHITFEENDAFLIGSNIPHCWLFESMSNKEQIDNQIDCIVTHFRSDFLGKEFSTLPEAAFLKELTQQAQLALHSKLAPDSILRSSLPNILDRDGMLRITALLESLYAFHNSSPSTLIPPSYQAANHSIDIKRMNKVLDYIRENFTQSITLSAMAELVQMTPSSFSRYFKQKTGQTPMQLVYDLRIAQACQLLRDPEYSLKEICYEAGFNNLVSFHKAFKKIKGTTPRTFRKNNLLPHAL